MQRLSIFVDAGNMFYAQRAAGWHIDFARVKSHFSAGHRLTGCWYLTATPPLSQPEKLATYRKYRTALINIGYTVIDKEVKIIKDPQTGLVNAVKGNLDVEIAFFMLTTAQAYDKCVLLCGDADFAIVVRHLRTIGKEVTVVGRRETTGIEVLNTATEFIDLTDLRSKIEKT